MTPYDKELIERCEKIISGLTGIIKPEPLDELQQLLNRFKELAMVDLDEVEKLVMDYAIVQSTSFKEVNHERIKKISTSLRAKIGYTTQHLNTEDEG